jgi:hypothetical protein
MQAFHVWKILEQFLALSGLLACDSSPSLCPSVGLVCGGFLEKGPHCINNPPLAYASPEWVSDRLATGFLPYSPAGVGLGAGVIGWVLMSVSIKMKVPKDRAGGVAQALWCLSCKCKALSSNPSTTRKKKGPWSWGIYLDKNKTVSMLRHECEDIFVCCIGTNGKHNFINRQ